MRRLIPCLVLGLAASITVAQSWTDPNPPRTTRICYKIFPRQIRIVSKIFAGKSCDLARIEDDISAACAAGLCDGLSRPRCLEQVRWKLEDVLFPANCEAACVPRVCQADSCRTYLDAALPFPKNCPTKCKATSGCPNKISCRPVYPRRCPSGTSLDETTCACKPDYECRKDGDCEDTNLCRPGLCTDTGICKLATLMPNCCVNDMDHRSPDAECSTETPFCGEDEGLPVGRNTAGTTCYLCENDRTNLWKDNGCNTSVPLCGTEEREEIPLDFLGDKCYTCLNDAPDMDQDLGCSPEAPQCGDNDRNPIDLSRLGDRCFACLNDDQCPPENLCRPGACNEEGSCFVAPLLPNCCINDQPSSKIDTECSAESPICGGDNGETVHTDETGTTCYLCQNDRSGGRADDGCPDDTPLCGESSGAEIPHDGLGSACFTCINDNDGYNVDSGCPASMPLCGDNLGSSIPQGSFGSGCFLCINDLNGTEVDTGCSPSQPVCGDASGEVDSSNLGTECLECAEDSQCLGGNDCRPGLCGGDFMCSTGTALSNCCINDQSGLDVDSECSIDQPLCGGDGGVPVANQTTGTTCYLCQNSNAGAMQDLGCDAAEPLCGGDMAAIGESELGTKCHFCQNTESGSDTDVGCDSDTPICGSSPIADDEFGTGCFTCLNDQMDGSTDVGCSPETPLCREADGSDLQHGEAGEVCFPCGSISSVAVCFAIDESGSICGRSVCPAYEVDTVNFVKEVIGELESEADDAQFGIVTFSSNTVDQSGGLIGAADALTVVDGLPAVYAGQSTATGAGFQECQEVLEGVVDGRPKLLIMVTDGNPNIPTAAVAFANEKAEEAKAANIVIGMVGVGSGIDDNNLNRWATSQDLVFSASNFADLTNIAAEIAATEVCVG